MIISSRSGRKERFTRSKRLAGVPVAAVYRGASRWRRRSRAVAIYYHGVAERKGSSADDLVPPIARKLFEEQIAHLARYYDVVPAGELPACREPRNRKRPAVAITFDDDLLSHAVDVLPILARWRLRATFYLTGSSLNEPFTFWWEDAKRLRDRDHELDLGALATRIEGLPARARRAEAANLRTQAGLPPDDAGLRTHHVRQLVKAGHEIGFHTREHHPLTTLSDTELIHALEDGRPALERVVGKSISSVAYPHGRADERVADAARRAGYATGYTTRPEAITPATSPWLLGRLEASHESLGAFATQVARAFERRIPR